jgi:hypothetical protein
VSGVKPLSPAHARDEDKARYDKKDVGRKIVGTSPRPNTAGESLYLDTILRPQPHMRVAIEVKAHIILR